MTNYPPLTHNRSLMKLFDNGVSFLAPQSLSYTAFNLHDGLSQLGIPVKTGSITDEQLVNGFTDHIENNLSYCTVIDMDGFCDENSLRIFDFIPPHQRTVSICMHDNVENFLLPELAPLFCTHENAHREISGIRIPIAFGLSQEMITKTSPTPFRNRENIVLRSFRPTLRQDVRASLDLSLLPALNNKIAVKTAYTDRHDDFLNLLSGSAITLAYGGCYSQNLSLTPFYASYEKCLEFYAHIKFHQDTVVSRWDSWRFWESLVCGCVTIHLDFDRYGFKLPVMPENWVHYVGLDLANLKQDVERLMDERNRWEEIGYNGRRWAIEHYSPIAVARRFIQTLSELYQL